MDLGSLLKRGGESSVSGGSTSSSGSTASLRTDNTSAGEGGRRGDIFQNKRKGMVATHQERRALRASESHTRRSEFRDRKFSRNRANVPDQIHDENEENAENTTQTVAVRKVKSRKEMLQEFRQKKLIEKEAQKKSTKPAFKAGYVHHPLAPIGAGHLKPNEYDKTITRSKIGNTTVTKNSSVLKRTTPKVTNRVVPGTRVQRNTILGLKKAEAASRKQAESRQQAKEKRPIETPCIEVTPATEKKRSSSRSSRKSSGSTNKFSSFAPDNFQFKPMNLPAISTPLRKNAAPKLRTFSSASSGQGTSDEADNVFLEDATTRSETVELTEKQIVVSTRDQTSQLSSSQADAQLSSSQAADVEMSSLQVADVEMSSSQAAGAQLSSALTADSVSPGRGRPRTRSRRISGVQPDPSINDEELAKTPARKVKERSLSSSRRASMSCYSCVTSTHHQDNHTHTSDAAVSPCGTPIKTPRTAAKTPRTARKTARKTTLPVVSESSPSHEEMDTDKQDIVQQDESKANRRKSRRSTRGSQSQETPSLTPKVQSPKSRRKSSRKSSVIAAEQVSSEEELAPSTSHRSRRSRRLASEEVSGEVEMSASRPRRSTRNSSSQVQEVTTPVTKTPKRAGRKSSQVLAQESSPNIVIFEAATLEAVASPSPRPRMGVAVTSMRRSTRSSSIQVASKDEVPSAEERKEDTAGDEQAVGQTSAAPVETEPEKNSKTVNDNLENVPEPAQEPSEPLLLVEESSESVTTPYRSSRKSLRRSVRPEIPMETESVEPESAPVAAGTPTNTKPGEFQFKTPTAKSIIKRPKSTAKKRTNQMSPFIDDRKNFKRKHSLSETKPKNSINFMFDDIPDGNSPVHEILAKKFRSSDNVSADEVEQILEQFRVQRLSDTFTRLGQEHDAQVQDPPSEVQDQDPPPSEVQDPSPGEVQDQDPPPGEVQDQDLPPGEVQDPPPGEVQDQDAPSVEMQDQADCHSPEKEVETQPDNENEEENKMEEGEEIKEVLCMAKAVEGQEESEHDVPYFRNLLVSETKRITTTCEQWEEKIGPDVPDDYQGQIRSVVGQGRLIMAERFKQFSGLVDNCEFGTGERTTSCMDLEGFWEMIYFQVVDVDKKFEELVKLEENGWKEIVPVGKKAAGKKKIATKKPGTASAAKSAVSGVRAHILAQRKAAACKSESAAADEDVAAPVASIKVGGGKPSIRDMIAAKRAAMKKKTTEPAQVQILEPASDNNTDSKMREFDGGFFSVKSPVNPISAERSSFSPGSAAGSPKQAATAADTLSPSSRSRSTGGDRLRRAVLTDSARRLSGMMVSPFVSAMSRRSLDPANSANPESRENSPSGKKPVRRSTLFDDMDTEDVDEAVTTAEATEAVTEDNSSSLPDPVVHLASPVTKTYSHDHSFDLSEHDQEMENKFDLLVTNKSETTGLFEDITPGRLNTAHPMEPTRSSARKSRSVKFSSSANSVTESNTVDTTPHPKSARRSSRRLQNDENISPCLIDFTEN